MGARAGQRNGGGRPAAEPTPYARVLELLFERRLPTGSFVSQAELVELTGVPVGPLRDALRVLHAEGVVTIQPRAGIQFIKPGLELTRATYQFRAIIERTAVEAFAETATDERLAELEDQHQAIRERVEQDGLGADIVAELEAMESTFHGAIVASLNNALIDASYRRLHNYVRILRLDRRLTPRLALQTVREHLLIIAACRTRQAAQAVATLQAHFDAALRRNLGLYRVDAIGQDAESQPADLKR